MSENPPDRRIARTRTALWRAMLDLLQTREWDEINVQKICDGADVARSSFYAHFDNKAALLDFGFAETITSVGSGFHFGPQDSSRLQTLDWLVDHVAANSGFFSKAVRSASGQMLFQRFCNAVAEMLREEIDRRGWDCEGDAVQFVVTGAFGLLYDKTAGAGGENFDGLKEKLSGFALQVLPPSA